MRILHHCVLDSYYHVSSSFFEMFYESQALICMAKKFAPYFRKMNGSKLSFKIFIRPLFIVNDYQSSSCFKGRNAPLSHKGLNFFLTLSPAQVITYSQVSLYGFHILAFFLDWDLYVSLTMFSFLHSLNNTSFFSIPSTGVVFSLFLINLSIFQRPEWWIPLITNFSRKR